MINYFNHQQMHTAHVQKSTYRDLWLQPVVLVYCKSKKGETTRQLQKGDKVETWLEVSSLTFQRVCGFFFPKSLRADIQNVCFCTHCLGAGYRVSECRGPRRRTFWHNVGPLGDGLSAPIDSQTA